MDILSDILKGANFSSAVYFKTGLTAPWGMKMGESGVAQFHLIVRGRCFVKARHDENHDVLYGGDIVVFPRGHAHWLADHPRSKKVSGQEMLHSISLNRNDEIADPNKDKTTLICGHFEWNQLDHPFFNELPNMIRLSVTSEQSKTFQGIVNLIIDEKGNDQPGEELVVNRLAEVLFIEILRLYAKNKIKEPCFLQALTDPEIKSALAMIHSDPALNWTLTSLARDVGLSRTLFANRFRNTIGQTPIDYLTNWRMIKAKELLRSTNNPISQVAGMVGYVSEVTFHRVFKSRFDTTPGAYRKSIPV